MNKIRRYCLFLLVALSVAACHHDPDETGARLSFSSSRVTFDTVFTTVGSVTKYFMVYNNTATDITTDILLAGGPTSNFSINVDGKAGAAFSKVVVPAHDSLFVHVKVNVDPGNQNTPFLITDSVVFLVNGHQQDVDLLAYGQDAHFIVADHGLSGSLPYKVVAAEHEVTHWTNDKPYVIYGWAAVDSLGTLIIDPGTQIYFHAGAGLWVYRYGNIQVNGTADAPVLFRGDRREKWYDTDYAQWSRIWINEGTQDNVINYAVITNAYVGVQVESMEEYLGNKTLINNSIIQNTGNSGVIARGTKVNMTNCQISNNGACCAQLEIGEYNLTHLTMVSYFSQQARKYPAVYVANAYNTYDNSGKEVSIVGNTSLSVVNSIGYGNQKNEVVIVDKSSQSLPLQMNVSFENCLFRLEEQGSCLDKYRSQFVNCQFNTGTGFVSNDKQDFNLKQGSPAIDAGKVTDVLIDLRGRTRDGRPDIGAYEYQE